MENDDDMGYYRQEYTDSEDKIICTAKTQGIDPSNVERTMENAYYFSSYSEDED